MEKIISDERLIRQLNRLKEEIQKQESLTKLNPFFTGMDRVFALEKEYFESLEGMTEIGALSQDQVRREKEKARHLIDRLLIDYIQKFEKAAFKQAMSYQNEYERERSYEKAYDEIQVYNTYLTTEIQEYIDEAWRDL